MAPAAAGAPVDDGEEEEEGPPAGSKIELDREIEWRRWMWSDPRIAETLRKLGPTLREVHTPPSGGLMKAKPPAWRFGEVLGFLGRAGLLTPVEMPRKSEIVGDPATATAFSLELTPQMVVRAWAAMRINPLPPGVRAAAPTTGSSVVLSSCPSASWMAPLERPKKEEGSTAKPSSGTGADFINGGGLRLEEDGGGVTYEEWIEVLVRCGEARYRLVTCGLPPDDASPLLAVCAESVLQHVAGIRSEIDQLQAESRIPFPRIMASEMALLQGETAEDLQRWRMLWGRLCRELDAVHLWPSWEPQAFALLRTGFPRLQAIFAHYTKGGWTSLDAEAAVTLSRAAWERFVSDCGIASAAYGREELVKAYELEAANGGGGELHVVQWVALLIKVAFLRVHTDYKPGDLDHAGMRPVPQCVDELLKAHVFPHASTDSSVEAVWRLRADAGVQRALAAHRPRLHELYSRLMRADDAEAGAIDGEQRRLLDERKKRDAAAADGDADADAEAAADGEADGEGADGARRSPRRVEAEAEDALLEVDVGGLAMDEWLELMERASDGWSTESVQQRSEVTGEPAVRTAWAVGLSAQQAMVEFMNARSVAEWWLSRLSYDGFVQALCRCGEAMFAGVLRMSPAQKVDGMAKLTLGAATRAAVVDEATYVAAPPRFDSRHHVAMAVQDADPKGQYTGSSAVPIGRWLDVWETMELSSLYGYPTWDKELYLRLQPHFATLCRLFAAYAAPPPRVEADLSPKPLEQWSADLELHPEQWAAFIADMGLGGPGATPSADELHRAFESQPPNGEASGASGARGLDKFIGALVGVAFMVENPTYAEAAAAGEVDLDKLTPVPEAAGVLLDTRVPLTLMRRCLARLQAEVELAKALMNDKQAKLQQARTRERNYAIEAAGALKRQQLAANAGGGAQKADAEGDEGDEGWRGRRRRRGGDGEAEKKKAVDPEELRADVEHRQGVLDDFSRVMKRKQADLVLLTTELEPLLKDAAFHANAAREAAEAKLHADEAEKHAVKKAAAALAAAGSQTAGATRPAGNALINLAKSAKGKGTSATKR